MRVVNTGDRRDTRATNLKLSRSALAAARVLAFNEFTRRSRESRGERRHAVKNNFMAPLSIYRYFTHLLFYLYSARAPYC